jgi:adenosylcobyric acid synthase
MGQTSRLSGRAVFGIMERNGRSAEDRDGCITPDGTVMGTYMHGMFDSPGVTRRWLEGIGLTDLAIPDVQGADARDREYDRLAAHFEDTIDTESILKLLQL